MKLLRYFVDPGEVSAAKSLLAQAGIATEVSNEDPHVIKRPKSGATRLGLWILDDDRFDDALRLLVNSGSDEEHPLDREAPNDGDIPAEDRSPDRLAKMLTTIALAICLLGLIAFTAIDALFQGG